jgi:hypothetical protein
VTVTSAGPATTSSTSPGLWVYVGAALSAATALILVALFTLRRRRPAAAPALPPQSWVEPPAGPSGPGPTPDVATYLETPDQVDLIPTTIPTTTVAEAPLPVTPSAAVPRETLSEFESVLAELDRIDAEMLKLTRKKRAEETARRTSPEPGVDDPERPDRRP